FPAASWWYCQDAPIAGGVGLEKCVQHHVAGINRWKINAVTNSNANAKPVEVVWPPATPSQSTSTMPASRPATERPGFGLGAKKAWRMQRAIHKPRIAESKYAGRR